MSAIWGILSLTTKSPDKDASFAMNDSMSRYKIDKIDYIMGSKTYFACGHQYITPEARLETLPLYDEEHNIYFTADCIIDNRHELLKELNIQDSSTPDGQLSFQAYLKWGEDFVNHLLGIFTFAIYDENKDIFLLYTDHMSNRCINYYKKGQYLYFASVYEPIKKAIEPQKLIVSEKWVTACEAEPSACMIYFPGLTPYEGLYQVEAAHYIKIQNGKLRKKQYWNPLKTKPIRFKNEEDYKKLFIDTYTKCIEDILRPGVKIGATLSSGLDSSSVVCIAASILQKRNEKIYTYTAVPEDGFTYAEDDYYIVDESPAVRKTAEIYPNIECEFVKCEGKSPLSHLHRWVQEYDFPIKSAKNALWNNECNKLAYDMGCKLMLTGQFGNATISYGNIFSLAYQQAVSFHLLKAKKSVKLFLNRNHVHKHIFISILKEEFRNKWNEYCPFHTNKSNRNAYIDLGLFRKYNIQKAQNRMARRYATGLMQSKSQHHNNLFVMEEMQQLSMYSIKDGLLSGVIERDPTRDKRIIELCMAYPITCFVTDGIDRYMAREYLKGIIPSHITSDMRHRGLQGADFITRINNCWMNEKDMVISALSEKELEHFINKSKLSEMLERCKNAENFSEVDSEFVIDMLYLVSLGFFLRNNTTPTF